MNSMLLSRVKEMIRPAAICFAAMPCPHLLPLRTNSARALKKASEV